MERKRFNDKLLRAIRNELSVRYVFEELCGYECKEIEGQTKFVCPCCHEMRTSIHPEENLGRCFRCNRNYNPIDFVMCARQLSFVESVKFLARNFPLSGE